MSGVEFRDLSGMAEFRIAEDLQRRVWGDGDTPDPADLMMVIQAEGGLVGGAFQHGQLVGYVFGFPTREPDVQHSHRLAVLPEARGLGLGVGLKLYQRRWCLAQGINSVRWTFDPLRATNAALNLSRLGARARQYHVDYYGVMEGINKGVPSDRLLIDWQLADPRVAAFAEGRPPLPRPAAEWRIAIPQEVAALLQSDPAAALEARLALRAAMTQAFAEGLAIVDFDAARREYLFAR